MTIGVTSSTGIETVEQIPAAVETPGLTGTASSATRSSASSSGSCPSPSACSGCPRCGAIDQRWLTGFMALTAGLLSFLGVEALFEAFELQSAVPGAFGGPGLVLLGVARQLPDDDLPLGTVFPCRRGRPRRASRSRRSSPIGIGVHNFGEGLAIGTSFAFGQLTLGSFLIIGFMIHNITEGLGIAAPAAEERSDACRSARLAALALIAGAPGDPRRLDGRLPRQRRARDPLLRRRGGRRLRGRRRGRALRACGATRQGCAPGIAVAGFLAGIAIMYVTGLIAG